MSYYGGNGGQGYNDESRQSGYGEQGGYRQEQYGRQEDSQYGEYGRPQGPPPGEYGRPQGPPPGEYDRPQGPPPGEYGHGGRSHHSQSHGGQEHSSYGGSSNDGYGRQQEYGSGSGVGYEYGQSDHRPGRSSHGISSSAYGAQEQGAHGYGRQQESSEYGRQEGSGGYGRQHESGGYGRQQESSDYGRQQESSDYGRQQGSGGYGHQQDSSRYGHQQDSSRYEGQNNSSYNSNSGYGQQHQQQSSYGGGSYGGRQNEQQSSYGNNQQGSYGNAAGGGGFSRPSSQDQSFGVDGYSYQYSQCSGKKKALFIGINYIGTANELKGCINDCHNVRDFLLTQGFSQDNMVMLSDDSSNKRQVPLKQNIVDGIQWLVKDAQPNDSLFFHYSGHGGQTEDKDGDEADGYDEVIYPLDFETAGFIDDDDLHKLLVNSLPKGTRLTALFDSCHSGSVLDLPYMYSTKGVIKEPNVLEEAGSGLLDTFKAYSAGNQKAMFQGIQGLFKTVMNKDKAAKAEKITKQTKTAPSDVILLSGCKDDQTSADAKEGGKSTGAMSYAFIQVMRQNSNQSYLTLLQNTRKVLKEKYSQKPQLSASHPIDTNLQFIV